MKSTVTKGLEPKKIRTSNRIFKTSLALVLLVFAFTMSSPSSFFQIIKPAEAAGTLNGIAILPTNNVVNTRGTYDFLFNTATTGTIKTIEMNFVSIAGSSFDINSATRYIERSGIGSGLLSISGSILKYTVNSPVSVPSGTTIRLEIPRIVNPNLQGFYTVSITTKDTGGSIIDGPTSSPTFPIKAITSNDIVDTTITGDDISPSFMVKKTLQDTTAGHAHGWNPNSALNSFTITDTDITGLGQSIFVSIFAQGGSCVTSFVSVIAENFQINCFEPPNDGQTLEYIITKLPSHLVTSSASVSSSESSSQYESMRAHDQIASEFP